VAVRHGKFFANVDGRCVMAHADAKQMHGYERAPC
jgi:hypothetical protein